MAITLLQMKQILDESKNKGISATWLQIAIIGTNVSGVISQHIDPEKYHDSDTYADTVQEFQAWLVDIITSKMVIVSKQVKIKKSIIKLVKEVENHPDPEQLLQIFYKNRYFFEKIKKKSH